MPLEFIDQPGERPWVRRGGFLVAALYSLGVLIWFHDCSWWPPDEGVYAHVAERVLDGEVLNRDVQNLHPGYVVFINAAALGTFGKDLLSLRYPLIAVAFLASLIVFSIGAKRSVLSGFVSSLCVSSLSVVQFLNPTSHWYCFFLFLLTIGVLVWLPATSRWRVELVGFLVTTIFLFRQLTGVIAAIGVVAWFLLEMQPQERASAPWLSRGLYLIMFAGLAGYLAKTTDAFSFLLFGIWPLAVLVVGMLGTNVANRDVGRLVARLLASAFVAFLPLLSYHAIHGSLGIWIEDTFITAFKIPSLNFISQPRYANLFFGGAYRASSMTSLAEGVNGLYWMLLSILPAALGVPVIVSLIKRNNLGTAPLPFLAVFYAIVSIHFQIPIYLYYTIALTACGLLWVSADSRGAKAVVAAGMLCFCGVGTLVHAGQPLLKYEDEQPRVRDIMAGERFELVSADLTRATLKIERSDRELYQWLLGLIEREVAADESIFVLPMNSELYFLSGRRNPFRFYCTSIGISGENQLVHILAELREKPPKLVCFRAEDKYNSDISRRIMEEIRTRYDRLDSRFGFEVYRWSADRAQSLTGSDTQQLPFQP